MDGDPELGKRDGGDTDRHVTPVSTTGVVSQCEGQASGDIGQSEDKDDHPGGSVRSWDGGHRPVAAGVPVGNDDEELDDGETERQQHVRGQEQRRGV
ncbi:hypothetical protein [Promicromonospora sp. NFX87]|uniref:hypothetical protein n=1 Tax=Promicromonospora sp. NFX87 TaxID=3402691 RepID=UPI003AFAEA1B